MHESRGRRLGRFLDFEVDLRRVELRRQRSPVKIQEKPFQILAALLERPGEVVTREELRSRLWAESTFVEFDDGINTAIRKLRQALGDSADSPRFIETLPRKGYRFLATVTWLDSTPRRRWLRPALALGALVFTILLVSRADFSDLNGPRIIETSRLTWEPGLEHSPAWSPDGRSLAFASDRDGASNVFVLQPGNPEWKCLACDSEGFDGAPSWSPDGQSVAFASSREGGGIYLVSRHGGEARRLLSIPFAPSVEFSGSVPRPDWFPDGRKLAYAFGPGSGGGLFEISLGSRQPEGIGVPDAVGGFAVQEPAWSPDGGRIAFVEATGAATTASRIWVLDVRSGAAVPATEGRALDRQPRWTPDGRRLIFLSNRGGSHDIWWTRLDSGRRAALDPRPLTFGVGIDSFALSRDGRRIAYSKIAERSNLWSLDLSAPGNLVPLTSSDSVVENVDVAPGGAWIAFDSNRSGNMDIWILSSDGSEIRQITRNEANDWCPSFSPDGREIVYHSLRDGQRDLYAISIREGAERRLTAHPAQDWTPRWSPDGRFIAFGSDRTGNPDLWILPAEGGEASRVTDHPGNDHNPVWAPDGRHLVFASDRSGRNELYLSAPDGTELKQLTSEGWLDAIPFSWPDESGPIYTWAKSGSREYPRAAFWAVSPLDGTARPIFETRFDERLQLSAALASDGGRLLFPLWERTGDVWLAELSGPF
jgi:Tol biopolymer transport system component/DNA-binding winged helix-turn-helix (wHTH) protein